MKKQKSVRGDEWIREEVEVCLEMVYKGKKRMYIMRKGKVLVGLNFGDSLQWTVKGMGEIMALICKYSGPDIEIIYV